jgi:hypothetical protein
MHESMFSKLSVFSLMFAFACSSPAKPAPADPSAPSPPATTSAPAASSSSGVTTASAADGPALGQKCGADDSCGKGSCTAYTGLLGPKGPTFKTCEIKCTGGSGCPDGLKCVVIADGPGSVCR